MFSNPRKTATIENWPSGSRRVTATFEVEQTKRGQRIARTTTGKPKKTTYCRMMAIVDGDDGKTYLLGVSTYTEMITILSSDMKHSVRSVFDGDDEFETLYELVKQAA